MTRRQRLPIHLLVLAVAASSAVAMAQSQDALTAAQVRAQLEAEGYTRIDDVAFDDGMWKADATNANGKRMDVRLHPRTGQVYPEDGSTRLGEADIRAALAAAGYTGVHDVKFDDGLWKAEATAAGGGKVELRMDPATGEVVGVERD
jgi:beta-glucanase (GH16 family)